jgi:hypothetical protein
MDRFMLPLRGCSSMAESGLRPRIDRTDVSSDPTGLVTGYRALRQFLRCGNRLDGQVEDELH